MREPIEKLYLLMLQAFRHEMGLLDDKTWCENLDILLEEERDQAKMEMNNKFGVSSAGYDNNSIFNSCLDEQFWSQNDVWEKLKPEILQNKKYMVYRIKDIIRTGTTVTFLFPDAVNVLEVREHLDRHIGRHCISGITGIYTRESAGQMNLYFGDNEDVTNFFEEYVYCEHDCHNDIIRYLKLKREPALESD